MFCYCYDKSDREPVLNHDLYEDDINNDFCNFIETLEPVYKSQEEDIINTLNGYHLRITGEKDFLINVVNDFIKKYGLSLYIFGYEEVEENHHVHGHVEYKDKPPTKQALSQWMKTKGLNGKFYHKKITTSDESNKLYVLKDLDIIKHNLIQSEFDRLISKTELINSDKKKDQRNKLLEAFNSVCKNAFYDYKFRRLIGKVKRTVPRYTFDNNGNNTVKFYYDNNEWKKDLPFTLEKLAAWIMYYYLDVYDKEPPLAHIKGYVIYIAHKNDYIDFSLELDKIFYRMFNN